MVARHLEAAEVVVAAVDVAEADVVEADVAEAVDFYQNSLSHQTLSLSHNP